MVRDLGARGVRYRLPIVSQLLDVSSSPATSSRCSFLSRGTCTLTHWNRPTALATFCTTADRLRLAHPFQLRLFKSRAPHRTGKDASSGFPCVRKHQLNNLTGYVWLCGPRSVSVDADPPATVSTTCRISSLICMNLWTLLSCRNETVAVTLFPARWLDFQYVFAFRSTTVLEPQGCKLLVSGCSVSVGRSLEPVSRRVLGETSLPTGIQLDHLHPHPVGAWARWAVRVGRAAPPLN